MADNSFNELVNQWLEFQDKGLTDYAQKLYNSKLFEKIISRFVENNKNLIPGVDTLFSVLGFTVEPIILTQRALNPKHHIIFKSAGTTNFNKSKLLMDKYLTSSPEIITMDDETFGGIYDLMLEKKNIYPDKTVIDITGGKKSMVASAAIFGRDFACDITYVDYTSYIDKIRRPLPGSEVLDLVYSVDRDLPEIHHIPTL